MKYRVIQWATGAMGKTCLRAIIDHPQMQLVGLYVYGEAKAGRDAGDIARRPPTGVIATRDVDEILDLDADVVIHCARLAPPYGSHDGEILKLLAGARTSSASTATAGRGIGVANGSRRLKRPARRAAPACWRRVSIRASQPSSSRSWRRVSVPNLTTSRWWRASTAGRSAIRITCSGSLASDRTQGPWTPTIRVGGRRLR